MVLILTTQDSGGTIIVLFLVLRPLRPSVVQWPERWVSGWKSRVRFPVPAKKNLDGVDVI